MSGEFDSVVSCFAIHHVEPENRVALYKEIKLVLGDNGLFINGDRFREEKPTVDAWIFDKWIEWTVESYKNNMGKDTTFEDLKKKQIESDVKLGDMPGTVWNMRKDLKKAGFKYVDCIYKNQIIGVMVAGKNQRK